MPLRTPTFLDALRDSPLLAPDQRAELTKDLGRRFPEPRALARELLQRGWLTPYQINQFFLGKGDELVLGSYIVLERLGEGGTGQVFKARHQKMGRVVALKVIRPELLTDAEVVSRFYREVRVLSQLAHPNVVHAYDTGPIGSSHVLVLEYVEGTDLSQRVKRDGPLPVLQACEYVRQAALGLQHVHENGLVHRDIKPSNLLVTRVGGKEVVKVLDLGLARLRRVTEGEITSTITPVGSMTMGTPDYLAPEQALDFHEVDIRADVYSLGCTFYYCLAGQPPFPGGSMAQKLMKHQQAEATPLERFRGDVPPALNAVLQRMIAKKPEERYPSPAEVADAVAAAVGLGPVAVVLPDVDDRTVPMAVPLLAPPPRKPRRLALFAGLGALVLAAVGGAFLLGPSSGRGRLAEGTSRTPAPATEPRAGEPSLAALRDLIRPDADENGVMKLPWAPTLWAARQRAAEQGKPIFLWETDGPPLGCCASEGIADRALVFSDPEVVRLTQDFVLVTGDDWHQRRRQDPEGDFLRAVTDQRNPPPAKDGGRQGYYCLTAEGKLLAHRGFNHDPAPVRALLRKALEEWNKLPEAQRKPGAVSVGPLANVDRRHAPVPPEGSRTVAVATRILDRAGAGWRRGTTAVPGAGRAARDVLWLTAADAWDPALASRPGNQFPLPKRLADRIARFHLVDNTRGLPTYWRAEDVRSLQVTVTVREVTADKVILGLEGAVVLATHPDPAKADRGYDVRLTGQLSYDARTRAWTRFDVAAVGEHWGEGPYNTGARPGRTPLGVYFELADDSTPAFVAPGAARDFRGYTQP